MAGVVMLVLWLAVLGRGAWQGRAVYEAFLRGARAGMRTAAELLPALCAMLAMLNVLRACGLMDALSGLMAPALSVVGLPPETAPMLLLRPLSGSGSLAALETIILECGVDSRAARVAAVLMGSSETIFYTWAVYLGATKVRRLPGVLRVSMAAYAAGAAAAGLLMR